MHLELICIPIDFSIANCRTVFQKVTENEVVVLELLLASSQLSLVYRSQAGIAMVTCKEKIPPKIWTHLAIQVQSDKIIVCTVYSDYIVCTCTVSLIRPLHVIQWQHLLRR